MKMDLNQRYRKMQLFPIIPGDKKCIWCLKPGKQLFHAKIVELQTTILFILKGRSNQKWICKSIPTTNSDSNNKDYQPMYIYRNLQ